MHSTAQIKSNGPASSNRKNAKPRSADDGFCKDIGNIGPIAFTDPRWHAGCYFVCRTPRWRRPADKMKLIIAYIQPERLNAVKQALFAREIYKMSVTNALGCGQQGGYVHMYRGATEEVSLHKKMRLAIGVNDDFIEKTIEAIVEGARTGDIGDGKIFVLPMDECVRIRTGERGPAAIG